MFYFYTKIMLVFAIWIPAFILNFWKHDGGSA